MDLEKEIFQKSVIQFEKLASYGFQKKDNRYIISKTILEDTFRIDVEISESGMIGAHVFDLSFPEEYTNYRVISPTGKFVKKVKEEVELFLNDIKNHCTTTNYFVTNQANRITELIFQEYHDLPEFPWENAKEHGVFRNPLNQKWYGLIMYINQNRLDQNDRMVEILNIKLPKEKIPILLKRKGFYPAYHMNKKNWITILLDDTISDQEILDYLKESHRFTEQISEWLIPANPKYYDMIHCFDHTDTIFWKQSSNVQVGDQVYIYVTNPYAAILYQCEVLEVEIPYSYQDRHLSIQRGMKLKFIHRFDQNQFPLEKLKEYGVQSVRGPRSIPAKLSSALKKSFSKNDE